MINTLFSLGDWPEATAGCDEAGRGALAGPVVASVVVLPRGDSLVGLDDSKKLTATQREKLAPQIKACAVGWSIGVANEEEIDRLNVLQATFLAMHRAIDDLLTRVPIELLLVDGNRFKPYSNLSHHTIVGGDGRVASIAAASILAKTYRDGLMRELALLYPVYQWQKNKGYATLVHRKAIELHGTTVYHRRSFKPCQELGGRGM